MGELDRTPRHPIRVASRRSGLTPDVLRAWERRYRAVEPLREGRRRLFTDEDIERLTLLRRATLAGRRIGDLAGLTTPEIRALVAEDEVSAVRPVPGPAPNPDSHLQACIEAVRKLDAPALERSLSEASVSLAQLPLLEGVVTPLLHSVGALWRQGSLRIAQEHLATGVVRSFLWGLCQKAVRGGPGFLTATPAGQIHELGALLAAVSAISEGWQVTHLGADLPAEELAAAAASRQVSAIGLSIVYPPDDPYLPAQLEKLRSLAPEGTLLVLGGASASSYADSIRAIGGVLLEDLIGLRDTLASSRTAQKTD